MHIKPPDSECQIRNCEQAAYTALTTEKKLSSLTLTTTAVSRLGASIMISTYQHANSRAPCIELAQMTQLAEVCIRRI
jgi:hypothetical protein